MCRGSTSRQPHHRHDTTNQVTFYAALVSFGQCTSRVRGATIASDQLPNQHTEPILVFWWVWSCFSPFPPALFLGHSLKSASSFAPTYLLGNRALTSGPLVDMAIFILLLSVLSLLAGWVAYSWYCLFRHYCVARKINVPLRLLPISHGNPFWMIVDRKVIFAVKRLLPWTSNSSFIRYNWRGWEVDERCKSHLEMGDVFVQVTPGGNSLYICNADSLMEIFKRRSDFPRPLQLFGSFCVYPLS